VNAPNIVYVIVHDLGRHLGCYGVPVASPHIDAFASEATLFRNAFCSAPACSPSRACAMTGQYSHVNGTIGLAHQGWPLRDDKKTVVDYLNEGGYQTLHFGLSHDRHPLQNHYQVDSERNWEDRYNTRRAFDKALAFMESHDRGRDGDHDRDSPFYMNIGVTNPHASMWSGNHPYADHGDPVPPDQVYVPPYLPDTPGTRESLGRFQAAIRFLDLEFGRFMDQADALGKGKDTVFIFTVDHGAHTGWRRDKMMCYDKGVEISLIVRMPDGVGAGRVVDDLIPNIDYAPTVLDLAGLPSPDDMNGRSFKSLLHGGAYEPHEAIFIERNFHGPFDPVRCVRTCDYHYMRNYHPQAIDYYPLPFELPADYRDEDKDSLPVKPRPEEELYHVRTDPMEFLNVAERPEHAGVKADLVGRMAQWMRDTDDFMLRGEVPQPHAEEGFLGWNPIDTIGSGKRQDTPIATPE